MLHRQGHSDHGALARLGVQQQVSPLAAGKTAAQRQPQSQPVGQRIHALRVENAVIHGVLQLRRNAAAVVRHLQQDLAALLGEGHADLAAGRRELGGVGYKVPKNAGGILPMDARRKVTGAQIRPQRQAAQLQRHLRLPAEVVKKFHQLRVLLGERLLLREHIGVGEVGNDAQQAVVTLAQDAGIGVVPRFQRGLHIAQSRAELGGDVGQNLR